MHNTWTKSQKKHAKELYDRALEREYAALMDEINRWEFGCNKIYFVLQLKKAKETPCN